jgi:hypothetical protein
MSMTSIEEQVEDVAAALPATADEVKQRLESLNQQVTTFIKQNAGFCLLGAVALGYVVARVARKVG